MAHCLAEEIVSSLHFMIKKKCCKKFFLFYFFILLFVFTLVRAFGALLSVVSSFLYAKVLCNQLGPSHLFAYNLNFFFAPLIHSLLISCEFNDLCRFCWILTRTSFDLIPLRCFYETQVCVFVWKVFFFLCF